MKNKDSLPLRIIEGLIWACLGALLVILMGAKIDPILKVVSLIVECLVILGYILLIYYKFMDRNSRISQEQYSRQDSRQSAAVENRGAYSDFSNLRMPPQHSSMESAKINRNNPPIAENQRNMQREMGHQELSRQNQQRTDHYGDRAVNSSMFSKIVLLNEQKQSIMEWNIAGKAALVIGKSTETEPVDIDLSTSTYAQMISKQHAVLNYTPKGWCLEDIDSKNGTKVQRGNETIDLATAGSVELQTGDIIMVAMTMLQLR